LGRETLHLKTIVAVTGPTNAASQHVLVKVGLAYERDFMNEGVLCALFRTIQ
jgi:RimJ/RimL family protein N-acetyltransferase